MVDNLATAIENTVKDGSSDFARRLAGNSEFSVLEQLKGLSKDIGDALTRLLCDTSRRISANPRDSAGLYQLFGGKLDSEIESALRNMGLESATIFGCLRLNQSKEDAVDALSQAIRYAAKPNDTTRLNVAKQLAIGLSWAYCHVDKPSTSAQLYSDVLKQLIQPKKTFESKLENDTLSSSVLIEVNKADEKRKILDDVAKEIKCFIQDLSKVNETPTLKAILSSLKHLIQLIQKSVLTEEERDPEEEVAEQKEN